MRGLCGLYIFVSFAAPLASAGQAAAKELDLSGLAEGQRVAPQLFFFVQPGSILKAIDIQEV